jgi:hypothetical protein
MRAFGGFSVADVQTEMNERLKLDSASVAPNVALWVIHLPLQLHMRMAAVMSARVAISHPCNACWGELQE